LAPGKFPSFAPPHPGGNGLGMLIDVGAVTVNGAALAGTALTAATSAATPSAKSNLRMASPSS
jgi:hypothetical protein